MKWETHLEIMRITSESVTCVYVTCETGYRQSERDAHITANRAYRAAQTSVASRSSV